MASRRITLDEKDALEQDGPPLTESDKSNITPAVPATVIIKLLAFSLAMIGGPIGTYYLTLHTVFKGNSTFAGATAAIMANFVLIAYVVVAMKEDQSERLESEKVKEKKGL
ncbi:MAG: vacuolar ATPase assembly integral membrane protein vma21 [Trichoglossum hirsutum]|nr:MAG: vacuolar ATPase assembly integral membrane protein vma21 [Trichoglossum hirsutum]